MKPFKDKNIKSIFNAYPTDVKNRLLSIRELIFDIALENDTIGVIDETLKWQQPSYLTSKPKTGTTIRLDHIELNEYAVYVHCQTSLIADFKEVYPDLKYDSNRAIVLDCSKKFPSKAIKHFIYLALSYHTRKEQGIGL